VPVGGDLLDDLVTKGNTLVREVEDYLRSLPPGAPGIVPLLIPFAAPAGSVLLAVLLWVTPDIDVSPAEAQRIRAAVETLQSDQRISPAQLSRALAGVPDTLRAVSSAYRQAERAEPAPAVVPSPTTIQRQDLSALRRTVATHETWREGHHGQVHGRVADAETQEAVATVAAIGAASAAVTATAAAVRTIVQVELPELNRELTRLVRLETQARRAGDTELREDLRARIAVALQRVGDLVRWLQTEALPELREDVRAERQTRRQVDQELRRRLQEEVEQLEETDTELATQLAPLVAWAAAFGVHTTEKVRRAEAPLDQLLNMDWSQLLLFAGFPGLVALVTHLLPRVAEATPQVLGALEGAAVRAMGEVF